jgi:trigger factor
VEDRWLKVEVEALGASRKRLRIEIPAERVHEAIQTSFQTIQKNAQIPGFRRSRAPMAVIRARYGDAVRAEVLDKLIPEVCHEAVDKNGIVLIGEAILDPPIEQMRIVEGECLAFALDVDVKPEIVVPDLKALEVDKRPVDVSSDEVEAYLTKLRENRAEFQDLETPRPVELSDAVYVSWLERDSQTDEILYERDSVLLEPAKVEQSPYRAVLNAVVGMQLGESKTVTVNHRTNPTAESPTGDMSNITITVKRIGIRVVPELDDAFARSLNYEDVAQLRSSSWNALVEQAKAKKRDAQRRELVEQLVAKSSFEVPDALIVRQQREMLMNVLANRRRLGIETTDEQIEEMFAGYRDVAEKTIRREWLFEEIAKANNIEISDSDLTVYVHNAARSNGQDPEKYEARIRAAERWEAVRNELRDERILNLMIENADEKRQLIY